MELNELLTTIFQVVIIPLLTVLTGFAVKWINAKAEEIKSQTDNQYVDKYVTMLNETISSAVIAVNQTYVESLKKQGTFDKAAQEEAFRRAFEIVIVSLTEDANIYLEEIIGDLNTYITAKIEEQVNLNK